MKRWIEFFRRCLRCLYEAQLAALVLLFVSIVYFKVEPNIYAVVWVFLLFIASYLIRELAPNNIIVFILHLVLGGMTMLLPFGIVEKIVYGICLVLILTPKSLIYVHHHSHLTPIEGVPYPSVVTVVIIYFFGYWTHSSLIINSAYVFVIIMLFCYLLLLYVESLSGYIEQTKDVSGIPLAAILKTNSKIVIAILCFLLFVLLAARTIDLTWVFRMIRNTFVEFFKLIASIFVFILNFLSVLASGEKKTETTVNQGYEEITPNDTYTIWIILEIVSKVFLVVLAGYLLYKMGKRLLKLLLVSRTNDQDIVERAETKKNIKRRKSSVGKRIFRRWSYEERIRKCYKYTIENFQPDIHLSKYQTSRDIETDIVDQELGDVNELTEIYTEVRYGNRKIDKTMLKRADALSKNAAIKGS